MSILIKGMKMPISCANCSLVCYNEYDIPQCGVLWHDVEFTINRPSDCPLVKLPPHGRLIDADALNDMINRSYPMTERVDVHNGYAIVQEMMKQIPTIIEAEVEDGNSC